MVSLERDQVYIGCAGWALRKEHQELFPEGDTHLERYAGKFNAVEINSSFYKPHRPAAYRRWKDATPAGFRFSVKTPREITHYRRLYNAEELLDRFLSEATALEEKLGPVLVQLPPQLALDAAKAEAFFRSLRERLPSAIVCEPRHETWFTAEAEELLRTYRIGRVAADPPRAEEDRQPGGDFSTIYYRFHGSPQIYYSPYSDEQLAEIRQRLAEWRQPAEQIWCIFDNTAEGHAVTNALKLTGGSQSTPHARHET